MTKTTLRPFQFGLGTLLVFMAVCALALGTWQWWNREQNAPLKDAHAGIQVSSMINAYLKANECTWPKNWDDLRKFYRVDGVVAGTDYCSFEEVRESWDVDFDADPTELARANPIPDGPPFRAIYPRHGRPLIRPEWEPNERVHTRLQRFAGLQTSAMVIEYMKANDGAWPGNWEDLQRYYSTAVKPEGGHHCSFEMAHDCVTVDFSADPAVLAQATLPGIDSPFRVIYSRHAETHRGDFDPNRRIHKYLTSQQPPAEPEALVTPKKMADQFSSLANAPKDYPLPTTHYPLLTAYCPLPTAY